MKYISNPSSAIDEQLTVFFQKVMEDIGDDATLEEVKEKLIPIFKQIYTNIGKPLSVTNDLSSGRLPLSSDFNDPAFNIYADILIAYKELYSTAHAVVNNFNYTQTEKSNILNRIKELNEMVTDYNILAEENIQEYFGIKETFNNKQSIDLSATAETLAYVSTKEGIVTLQRTKSENLSTGATITIDGNGEIGNTHVIKSVTNSYSSTENAHNSVDTMLDERPDTWFEYQMVNIPDAKKIEYEWLDLDWAKGKEIGDNLRLILTVTLNSVTATNWITINPCLPPNSTGKVTVYSLATSENGIDYEPIYDGKLILNSKLNLTPQSYSIEDIASSDNFDTSKFAQQGVWSFPVRNTKYIQIVFDQSEPYAEKIGHTCYARIIKKADGTETRIRIPEAEVSDNIKDGPDGQYSVSDSEIIEKGIDITDGWRYAIGIRDIGVYQFNFAKKSEVTSIKYTTPNQIDRITLAVNEKIPAELQTFVEQRNDWIKYYVSLDDINWYEISPMHHQKVGEQEIPPQIYLVNSPLQYEDLDNNPNRGYITTQKEPTSIRFKAVISRPDDLVMYTPILEDYLLKLYLKEEV